MLDYNTLVMIAESALADIGVYDSGGVANLAEIGLVCDTYQEAERMINAAACGNFDDFSDILEALS